MTRRRVALAVTALAAAGLLAACSGGDDEPAPSPTSTSVAPSSPMTPPPISPRTTVTFAPGATLPPASTGVPIPIPSDPQS